MLEEAEGNIAEYIPRKRGIATDRDKWRPLITIALRGTGEPKSKQVIFHSKYIFLYFQPLLSTRPVLDFGACKVRRNLRAVLPATLGTRCILGQTCRKPSLCSACSNQYPAVATLCHPISKEISCIMLRNSRHSLMHPVVDNTKLYCCTHS